MSAISLDRTIYLERLGDPTQWNGDWRRHGNYLAGDRQDFVHERLERNRLLMIGMMIRQQKSTIIAAALCVSREAVDRRRRDLGLSRPRGNPPGVGPVNPYRGPAPAPTR
jgi:hypothetical protein